jgi:hypothetical protein
MGDPLDKEKIVAALEQTLRREGLPEELIERIKSQALQTITLETISFELPESLDEKVATQKVNPIKFELAAAHINKQSGQFKRISNILKAKGFDLGNMTNLELLNLSRKIKSQELIIKNIGDTTLKIFALYLRMI